LVNVLWDQWQKVADQGESMNLELLELRWLPSVELWAVRLGVQVHQDGTEEVCIHHLLVSLPALGIPACVENCGPEQLLELNVLVIGREDPLLLSWLDVITMVNAVELINCCVVHQNLEEAATIGWVLLEEERMTDLLRDDVVDQDGELVPQALVIKLVSLLDDVLEGTTEVDHNSLISGH
jgi:hypothetical protein